MIDPKILKTPRERTGLQWLTLLPCLLLVAALAACAPEAEEGELVAVEESAPDAAPAPVAPADVPESAPLGSEPEARSPGEAGTAPGEPEPIPETATTPVAEPPAEPEELASEIEAAEPVPPAPAPLPSVETQALGKEVFLGQRCNSCHGVSSAGIEGKTAAGGDLGGIAERLDRSAIEGVLRGEDVASGKPHPKRFTGTQAELDALIDWLLSQQ